MSFATHAVGVALSVTRSPKADIASYPANSQASLVVNRIRVGAINDHGPKLWFGRASQFTLALVGLGSILKRNARSMHRQAGRRISSTIRKAGPESWLQLTQEAEGTTTGKQLVESRVKREEGLMPHTDALIRYFGEDRKKPRVTLFRDRAGWCPYCQKVWLLLEEKRVDYAVVKVPMRSYGDKPESFLSKIPNGLLPAIEIDGRLMTESLDIMVAIERTFPDPEKPMIPPNGPLLDRSQKLLKLERELFGAWCSYLFRPDMPFIGGSEGDFTNALEKVDRELGSNRESPFFLPYSWPTLVDMQYVSHVERCVASAMYYKGYNIRKRFPNIDRWLSAYELLPQYMATKSDYYTHCMDIPPQYGSCYSADNDEAKQARAAIDPAKLRVPVLLQSDIEPLTAEQLKVPEEQFRIEAAWSVIRNHEAVVRFCARGAGPDVGKWGFRNPTKCQLADPYAKADEKTIPAVDVVLRIVVASLLRGDPDIARGARAAAEVEMTVPPDGWGKVVDSISYLRNRIGSPRDVSMPAAKLLRAYLNEAVVSLQG